MKFLSTTLFFLLAALSFGQTSGKIIYDEKVDMYRHIPEDRQDIRNRVPQYHTAKWDFIFNGDESIYMRHKEEETEMTSTQGNTQTTMRFGGRENRVVYKNLTDSKMIDSRDFMQKQFLITGAPTIRKWKIGKNSKNILGYNCLEASFQQDSATNIKAWFSPQITHFNGPADYQGLPGMILELDFNDGERVLTASEIKFEGGDTSLIVAPTKGKEVTAEEFETIREEKMKEMQAQGFPGGPGGAPMQVTIIRN
ncbi:MAG TPA: GLPGLI family protein [Saprospiraceae bacterium]|nr:GLPGLI family protein [Saprospiraceae bacterium]